MDRRHPIVLPGKAGTATGVKPPKKTGQTIVCPVFGGKYERRKIVNL
jgi:hypothetical protein